MRTARPRHATPRHAKPPPHRPTLRHATRRHAKPRYRLTPHTLRHGRTKFSTEWKAAFKQIKYPEQGLVFDYFVPDDSNEFVAWADKVPAYSPVGDVLFTSIVVPTADLVRLTAPT